MLKWLTLFAITLIQGSAFALSIQETVQTALATSQQVAAAKKNLEKETLAVAEASSGYFPSVSLQIKRDKNFYAPQWRKRYENDFYKSHLRLTIEQEMFSGGGTINKVSAANSYASYARENYSIRLNEIVYNIISSYQKVISLRAIAKINDYNVLVAENLLTAVTKALEFNADTLSNLHLLKAELSQYRGRQKNNAIQLVHAENYFEYLTNLQAPRDMTAVKHEHYCEFDSYNDFLKKVAVNNKYVKSKYHIAQYKKAQTSIAVSDIFPVVSASYNISKISGVSDQNKKTLLERDGHYFAVNINVPLYYRGGLQYIAISKARKDHQVSELEFKDAEARVQSEAKIVWAEYISAKDVLKHFKESENSYHKRYKSIKKEYDSGAQTIGSLTQAQRDSNIASIQTIMQQMDLDIKFFNLYKVAGKLPELMLGKQ
jgi:outer membrane protein